jgi:hypothetical protein
MDYPVLHPSNLNSMQHRSDYEKAATNKFGTFAGVFTPSILTILGAVMFLRGGFVVGHAGLISALAYLLIAEAITLAIQTGG